jgi:hypothetical protein
VKRKGAPVKRKGPQTLREWLAQGRGSYGGPIGRGDMTAAHARHLIETYPGLFRHADSPTVSSSPAFARYGFGCGDGWFDIIDRLAMKLVEDPYLVAVQVKEKLAELRFYLDRVDGAPAPDPVLAKRLEAERAAARKRSRRTCELCGAPGKLEETKRHWFFVRCESCNWLDDMTKACRHLEALVEDVKKSTFVRSVGLVAASKNHICQHLGEGAGHQPREVRKRFPSIPWKKLDAWRWIDSIEPAERARAKGKIRTVKHFEAMILEVTPAKLWQFIKDEVPKIAEALR